jgi:hypothetical protein
MRADSPTQDKDWTSTGGGNGGGEGGGARTLTREGAVVAATAVVRVEAHAKR